MKKISTILALILLLNVCFSLVSCSQDSPIKSISLTSSNLTDYLSVNVLYDYNVIYIGKDSSDVSHYDIYCNVTIKTAPKCSLSEDYKFLDASVSYIFAPLPSFGITWTSPSALDAISVDIGCDGYSEASFVMFARDVTRLSDYTFESTNKDAYLKYTQVSGSVICSLAR